MSTNDQNATGPQAWVLGPAELIALIEACRTASEVVMDLETTGLDEHAVTGGASNGGVAARISLASFTVPQEGDDGRWDGETPVTYILPLSHPNSPWLGSWRKTLRRVLNEGILETNRAFTNANIKFDARWCYALLGVDLSANIVWDTMVSSHLMDETRSTKLKDRAPETFGIPPWNDFDLSVPGASERVPLIELGEYAARDTWWTWRLKQEHMQQMFLRGGGYPEPINDPEPPDSAEDYLTARLGHVATWVSMPTVASLTKMEQHGFRLDVPWSRDRLAVEVGRREGGLDLMAARYGQDRATASAAATSNWFKAFTSKAVEADDLRIGSMTRNGNPQWNKGVLRRQAARGSEVAEIILEQRRGTKLAEYLSAWLGFVRADGKIHANYNAGRVSTGRLSSNWPNMQQVTKELRPAFIPSPGYVLADFDFSQLELRVAAFVARCVPMIEAFHRGDDLHKLLGVTIVSSRNVTENQRARQVQLFLSSPDRFARVNDKRRADGKQAFSEPSPSEITRFKDWVFLPDEVSVDDITAYERQKAKSANFGLLYLQAAEGFRDYAEDNYGVTMSMDEAYRIHSAFFEKWEGMHDWHEETKRKVRRDGYIVSPIGRVRRLPGIWDGNQWREAEAERQAVNSPVQGTGSDLMQMAAADIQGLLPGTKAVPGVRLVATVHDSIVAELPEGNWLELAEEIRIRMERSGEWFRKLGVDFDVPIVADYGVGTRWSLTDVSDAV